MYSRKVVKEIFDHMDGGYSSEYGYVKSFKQVKQLSDRYNIDINEALESLVIEFHKSRRIRHNASWRYFKFCVIPKLQSSTYVKESCCIIFDNDKMLTPMLGFKCPKHCDVKGKSCPFSRVLVNDLISKFQNLEKEAYELGYEKIGKEFSIIANQLFSVQMSALHQLIPHRVTMCPSGKCAYGGGFILPHQVKITVPKCGHKGCTSCGFKEIFKSFKTTTCPGGCTTDDPDGIEIEGKVIQVPLRWCTACGGSHGEDDICDHKSAWKRLPKSQRDLLEDKVKNGFAQHCPNCFLIIEKSTGCDKLTCPECGTKFCLKCGDKLSYDYVTSHLLTVNNGLSSNDMICRKTAVLSAIKGEKYVDDIVNAYKNGSKLVINDVNKYISSLEDFSTVPKSIINLIPCSDEFLGKSKKI